MKNQRVNEYDFPGSSGIPSPLCRRANNCEQLVDVLDEAAFYREMDAQDIAEASGVPAERVDELMRFGRGSVGDLLDVLDALDVEACTIPDQGALARGIDG